MHNTDVSTTHVSGHPRFRVANRKRLANFVGAAIALGIILPSVFAAPASVSALDGNDRCLVWTSTVVNSAPGEDNLITVSTSCSVWERVGSWVTPLDTGKTGEPKLPTGPGFGDKSESCAAVGQDIKDLEEALRWAQDNVLGLEKAVSDQEEKTQSGMKAWTEANAAYAAAVAATTEAKAAYSGDVYRTRYLGNGREVEDYVGYDINTPEGKAIVAAEAAERAALLLRNALYPAMTYAAGTVAANNILLYDTAKTILSEYGKSIEIARQQYSRNCR